jgi:hypothetical protein
MKKPEPEFNSIIWIFYNILNYNGIRYARNFILFHSFLSILLDH